MSDELRHQRKCYFASREYSESFWGKYIYLYQGRGSLRLTTDSLSLEDCPGAVEIPFQAIKSIGLDQFSSWAKPFGLSRLTVSYTDDGEPRTIHLVPYESGFDPTPVTSEIVANWHERLGRIEELTNRVQPPQVEQAVSRTFGNRFLFAAVVAPLVILGLIGWLINH
ncbi:hypothetical protein P12x_005515 [Tundrisphaera lichenicola]|uniref:hypothetical protein n=1 Tax=Tundrisphaera lichenicola TaxID=2029860 RepID=UPI003EB96698